MSDLTDRMRTCAAYLIERKEDRSLWAGDNAAPVADAIDLLLEASNALEAVPEPLGEPMEIIPPVTIGSGLSALSASATDLALRRTTPKATWTAGDLPVVPTGSPSARPNRVCPQCDSRANKRVFRQENKVMLTCPVCAFAWEYKP